jgi:predicted ester cyclase
MPYARVSFFQYKPGTLKDAIAKAEQKLVPLLRQQAGFLSFSVVARKDDMGLAITSWQTRENAEAGMQQVGRWADENLGALRLAGEAFLGEVRLDIEASLGIAIVEAIYAAFNEKDIDRAISLATPDAKVLNIPFGTEHSFKDYMQNWATAFPDGKIENIKLLQSGDSVVAEYIGRGTHTGTLQTPMGPIPATNRRVQLRFAEVLELRDAKVARGRAYFDSASFMRQLGLGTAIPTTGTNEARPEARH